jgi:hypothetical protein
MVTTAACGAQTVSSKPVVSAPRVVQPTIRPAFTAADFNTVVADDTRAVDLYETPSDRIPYGRATYDGHVRSGAVIESQSGYDVVGALELEVEINSRSSFADRNPVTGQISDVTVIDRQSGDLLIPLSGTLDIQGGSALGEIEATAIGDLTRERNGSADEAAQWSIDLDGSFRDDFTTADTIAGTATGGTIGGGRDDYNVTLTGDGRFYGEER